MQHLLLPNRRCNAFTLVELLVVVAIISVVAALLLPSLHRAVESARRAACLSDRKQNYLAYKLFVDDHRNRVPCMIGSRNGGTWTGNPGQPMEDWVMQNDADDEGNCFSNCSFVSGSRYRLHPVGTLAVRGYLNDPKLMYCVSFKRCYGEYFGSQTSKEPYWHLDDLTNKCGHGSAQGGNLSLWACFTNGDPYIATKEFTWIGITHYLTTGYPSGTYDVPSVRKPKERYYVANYRKSSGVSPLVFSCANGRPSVYDAWGWGAPDFDPIKNLWDMETSYWYNTSHGGAGVNACFIDGSGRWIRRDEVRRRGKLVDGFGKGPDYMTNNVLRHKFCNFQTWAKRYARIGGD